MTISSVTATDLVWLMKYVIYVSKGEAVTGPFTKRELREAVHAGSVSLNDWAWHKALSAWEPVLRVLPTIYVSRHGEIIAEFDDQREILSGLRNGTLVMEPLLVRGND